MTEPTSSTRGRRTVGHRAAAGDGDRLRDQLLDAAEAQLVAKGSIQGVSLRQVARDVGVSATSVYLHFSDKDDLFIHVCQRRFEAFAQLLRDARTGQGTPTAQLRACGTAYVRFGLDHPEQYAVLFGGLPLEEVTKRIPEDELVGLQALTELAEVVQAGIAAGEFRPVDPFATALSLWALCHGLVGVVSHGSGKAEAIDPGALIEVSLNLCLHGLKL